MLPAMWALALERTVLDGVAPRDAVARAWREVRDDLPGVRHDEARTELTIVRNAPHDFRDRQVYLWVDDQALGKLRYDVPISLEIPPGPHRIRVHNTLFRDTFEFVATPGEHVRVRCTNGIPIGGWVMLAFLHIPYLRVKLERDA